MKKVLVAAAAILIFIVRAEAQRTSFGIKGGINVSSLKIKNGADYEAKTGFHAGGLAHIHLNNRFAIQPELLLSLQGGERNENNRINLTYLNMPVIVQYMILDGLRLQTGPQIGFLLDAEQKINNVEVDVSDVFSTVDVSWSFGTSYLFDSGFGFDARYNLGLNNISDDHDFEARNRSFQAGIFYQFRNR
ncbi:MAG TPA: porin family protein [Chitinophagaceae bacterium]|nr:porin family protein [Chitinophagaceae bacterium]